LAREKFRILPKEKFCLAHEAVWSCSHGKGARAAVARAAVARAAVANGELMDRAAPGLRTIERDCGLFPLLLVMVSLYVSVMHATSHSSWKGLEELATL